MRRCTTFVLTAAPAILFVTVLATISQPGVPAPLSAQDIALGPASRHSVGMSYDGTRHEVVLFGGTNGLHLLDDVSGWMEEAPARSPSKRSSMGMAYDAARTQVVLFGGRAGSSLFRDTWTWDGTTWTRRDRDTL